MTAADVARKVLDHMLALLEEKVLGEASSAVHDAVARSHYLAQVKKAVDEHARSIRASFERAIIELRFEVMEVQVLGLDMLTEQGRRDAEAAYERGKATADGMDIEVVKLCARCSHGEDMHGSDATRAHKMACTFVTHGVECECPGFVERIS